MLRTITRMFVCMTVVLLSNPLEAAKPMVMPKMKLHADDPSVLLSLANLPSQTEMWIQTGGGEFIKRVNQYEMDWQCTDQKLMLGWSTKASNIVSGIWQVATFRFPQHGANYQQAPGLVASGGSVAPSKSGAITLFYIDFAKLGTKPAMAEIGLASKLRPSSGTATCKVTPVHVHGVKLNEFPLSRMTYYVRLVPVDRQGRCVGLPSAPVKVFYGEKRPPTEMDISHKDAKPLDHRPEMVHPAVRLLKYEPIRWQDPHWCYKYVVVRDFPMMGWKKGQKLDLTPHQHDKSWWDKLTGWVGDALSFASGAINWVADAYNDIKQRIIGLAPEWAQGPLSVGMDIALTSMGVPPTLPNFDDFVNLGEDYMVNYLADVSGVPPDVAKAGVNKLKSEARNASQGSGNSAIFMVPDPDALYRPAYVEVEVTNPGKKPTDRCFIDVRARPVGDADADKYAEDLFDTEYAYLPGLKPGQRFVLPMMLKECTANRQLDTNLNAGRTRFLERYARLPGRFSVSTRAGDQWKNNSQLQQSVIVNRCQYAQKF